MGLDMYLYLSKYESVSRHDEKFDEKAKGFYPDDLKDLQDFHSKRNFLSNETKYQIGYWRKANAIHKWFVDNCANGVDECQEIWVTTASAKTLLSKVKAVLKDHSKAKSLLPTSEGFFFGTTEYDDWYFEDLKYTEELLEKVIKIAEDEKYEIFYQASW